MKQFLPENPYRLKAYIQIFAAQVIWGIAVPVIKYTLSWFDPLIFLNYRFAISAVLGLFLMFLFGLHLPRRKPLILLILLTGFLNTTVALGLLFLGFDKTTAVNGVLIGATAPIFVGIAGALFLHEHVTLRERIGIATAFAGTVVTLLEPILKLQDELGGFIGNILILASVLVGVAVAILSKKILQEEVSPATTTNLGFIIGFITLTPILLFLYPISSIIDQVVLAPLQYHAGVWFMAIFSGTVAYILWHKAQKTIEVGEVAVFAYLTPLISIPLAIIWLRESISVPFIIGAGIIILGVLIAEWKKRRYNKQSLFLVRPKRTAK